MSKKSERIEVAPDCFVVSARGPSLSGNSMSDTVADIVASTRRQVNDLEKLAEKLREINFTTTITPAGSNNTKWYLDCRSGDRLIVVEWLPLYPFVITNLSQLDLDHNCPSVFYTVDDILRVIKEICEGVYSPAPVTRLMFPYGVGPAYGGPPAPATIFELRLNDAGPNRIAILKEIQAIFRDFNGEEKNIIEVSNIAKSAPCTLLTEVSKTTARKYMDRLTALGAKVDYVGLY